MDTFEENMEIQYIVKLHIFECIVFGNQGFHTCVHLFGLYRFSSTYLIGEPFVVSHGKPIFMTVGSIHLKDSVQLFNVCFCYLVHGMINDIVDATEMIDSLHDIIHRHTLGGYAQRIGFEDKTSLFLTQTTTLYVIGIIGQIYLRSMIDASIQFGFFFFTQTTQQGIQLSLAFWGQLRIRRNIPCLSSQECSFNFSFSTIITSCPLTDAVFFGKLNN